MADGTMKPKMEMVVVQNGGGKAVTADKCDRIRKTLESLPDELLIQIIAFLPPSTLITLHRTSRRLRALSRAEPSVWRTATIAAHDNQIDCERSARRRMPFSPDSSDPLSMRFPSYARHLPPDIVVGQHQRVDWFEEWKWRFAPVCVEWLDHGAGYDVPRDQHDEEDAEGDGDVAGSYPSTRSSSATSLQSAIGRFVETEVRGMTAFESREGGGKDMLLSPLSDGSVAIFDVRAWGDSSSTKSSYDDGIPGSVVGRSRKGLISVEVSTGRGSYLVGGNGASHRVGTKCTAAPSGVVECISVDSASKRAWVANESRLVEIDLNTLQRVAVHPFAFSITALSQTSSPFPLTVCTTSMIHMHDPRLSPSTNFPCSTASVATLHQTGALSVLHSNFGQPSAIPGADDLIYIAGRFKVILSYDRRMFPKLRAPMYTGASLCTLSSFVAPNSEETLVAGGEYNGRGSLELYPTRSAACLPPPRFSPRRGGAGCDRRNHCTMPSPSNYARHNHSDDDGNDDDGTDSNNNNNDGETEIILNRQSASRSKLLAVDASAGTRIVTGDADGVIRWVERDGREEVRRVALFPPSSPAAARSASSPEVVRKLVSLPGGVAVWTGERIAMVGVGAAKRRGQQVGGKEGGGGSVGGNDDDGGDEEEAEEEEGDEERQYVAGMRRALERMGDEVGWLRGLGELS